MRDDPPPAQPNANERDLIRAARAATRRDGRTTASDPTANREQQSRFLDILAESRLIAESRFDALCRQVVAADRAPSAETIAAELVKKELLTHWQARMLLRGQRSFHVGNYVLVDFLGRGGMGSVFKATHVGLNKTVALKVMSNELLGDAVSVARFHREMEAAAALDHPNLVHALDAGRCGDKHYLVMEYVEGENLSSVLKRTSVVSQNIACHYALQAAEGLAHIHARGLVHRDIKPSNLILTTQGDGLPLVKILDLGLARLNNDAGKPRETMTRTDQVLGTPDYMSPEQARATRSADIRSDIYSLGCALFRMLTGRLPFPGDNVFERVTARIVDEPPKVRNFAPDIDEDVERVILKMMARGPADRYQSPREVVAALTPFADLTSVLAETVVLKSDALSALGLERSSTDFAAGDDSPHMETDPLATFFRQLNVETRIDPALPNQLVSIATVEGKDKPGGTPLPMTQQAAERKRSAKKRIGTAITVGLVVVALMVAAAVYQAVGKATVTLDWPTETRTDARLRVDGADMAIPAEGPIRLQLAPGKQSIRIERDDYLPIEHEFTLERKEKREIKIAWKPTPRLQREIEWKHLQADANPFLTRNAKLSNSEFLKGAAAVRDRLQRFERRWAKHSLAGDALRLRHRLPFATDFLDAKDVPELERENAIVGIAPKDRPDIVAIYGDSRIRHWEQSWKVAFTPNGDSLVSVPINQRVICIWNPKTGELRHRLTSNQPRGMWDFRIDSQGRYLAALVTITKRIVLFDLQKGVQLKPIETKAPVNAVEFLPDGRRFVYVGDADDRLRMWDLDRHQEIPHFAKVSGQLQTMAMNAKGTVVAAVERLGGVHLFDVATGKRLAGFDPRPHIAPAILTAAVGSQALIPENPWNWKYAKTDRPRVRQLKFSPDARYLAVHHLPSGSMLVWDVKQHRLAFVARQVHATMEERFAFSPDSRWMAIPSYFRVQLWNLEAGREQKVSFGNAKQKLNLRTNGWSVNAMFSPDSESLVFADGTLSLDAVNLKSSKRRVFAPRGHCACVRLAFHPDGEYFATAENHGLVRLWDMKTGKVRNSVKDWITAFAVNPKRDEIAMGNRDGELSVANFSTGNRHTIHRFTPAPLALTYNSKGDRIGAAFRYLGTAAIVDDEGRSVARFNGKPRDLTFVDDDRQIVTANEDGHFRLFDATTGEKAGVLFKERGVVAVVPAIDRRSAYCLLQFGKMVQVDVKSKRQLVTVPATNTTTTDAAIDPTGRLVAVSSTHSGVHIFQRDPLVKKHHAGFPANSLDFSPDGSRLVLGTTDGWLKVIDTEFFEVVKSVRIAPPGGKTRRLRYTRDGRHVVTLNSNGTAYVVRLEPWPQPESRKFK